MTTNQVNETVDHVSQALDTAKNDTEQVTALEKFQDEVKKDMQGMTPDQVREYMPQLTKVLEEKNQLPVLALAFAEQLGGDLNESDLRSEVRSANRAVRDGDNSRQLDQVFLKYLADNYDEGANLIETKNDAWLRDDANISQADISAKLAEFRQARDDRQQKESNQEYAGNVAAELLAGGDQSLFNFMDRNSKNGKVTYQDALQYLRDARASGSTDGHFAPEKQELVKQLVDDWADLNRGFWLRGNSREKPNIAMTKSDLIHASGNSSEEELFADRRVEEPQELEEQKPRPQLRDLREVQEEYWESPESVSDQREDSESDSESTDQSEDAEARSSRAGDSIVNPNDYATLIERRGQEDEMVFMPVRKGDSYWRIANRILGEEATPRQILEKMNELIELNDNKPLIYTGGRLQTIRIPSQKAEPQPRNRVSTLPGQGQMLA